jgi:hypothetical protein
LPAANLLLWITWLLQVAAVAVADKVAAVALAVTLVRLLANLPVDLRPQ